MVDHWIQVSYSPVLFLVSLSLRVGVVRARAIVRQSLPRSNKMDSSTGRNERDGNQNDVLYSDKQSIYCYRATMPTSTGIWLGDNPLRFSLPILLYQLILIFVFSHLTHLLLRRFGQPFIISQIVAGLLLGPTFFGRVFRFEKLLFARQSFEQLGTIAIFSFMLFYFVTGVKADLGLIPKVGKKAVTVAVCGTLLPYIFVYLAISAFKNQIPPAFMDTTFLLIFTDQWCLTSYAVLSGVLNELNLLTSKVGRLAMSASLIADIIHLFAHACIGTYMLSIKDGADPMWAFSAPLSFLGLVAIIMFVMRPLVFWLIRRTPDGALLSETSFVAITLMALACGLMSIVIGFDFVAGPFFFGMVLPGGAPLGTTLEERIDRFVGRLLMPVCVALAGMRMDFASLVDPKVCGFMELFVVLCVAAKFIGVVVPCFFSNMPRKEALALGLMMVSKGIYEVGYALQWKDNGLVDNQLYTMIVISILILGCCTTPLIKYVYRPEDRFVTHKRRTLEHALNDGELRLLACVYEEDNVNPILALTEASGLTPDSPVCVYLLHLNQLVGRADAILIPYKLQSKSATSFSNALSKSEHIVNAFLLFEKQYPSGLSVLPFVCVSPYNTMHDDICSLAHEKKVTLVILPFHKRVSPDGAMCSVNPAVQAVNLNVLRYAPCSVGILIDNGLAGGGTPLQRVAVYFLGGPDDREALALGTRIAKHSGIGLTLVCFLPPREWRGEGQEDRLDEMVVAQFLHERVDGERVEYREVVVKDSEEMVGVIRETSPEFSLLIVGRRAGRESMLTAGLSTWSEYPELGVVGDLLASRDFSGRASTLVVHQQVLATGVWAEPERIDSSIGLPETNDKH